MPEKISLFALTVVDISVTKQLVCDNHHQVFFSHLITRSQNKVATLAAVVLTGGLAHQRGENIL